MERDAATLPHLPAKFASRRLQLTQLKQCMFDWFLRFEFHTGDHKSNGQITNGLVDHGENRACSLRRLPFFLHRVGKERVTKAKS
eukprot:6189612-Pleurochrysis_carterae.AAC.1